MQRDPRSYLWDIRDAANAISVFVAEVDFEAYRTSPLIHSAVERKFEIIGEALNLLAKSNPSLAARIPEFQRIIAFRNLLIHGYAVVEHARVWSIVRDFLPELESAIEQLLNELAD
jgi:uncharacterized protein with HEPN domain